MGRVLPWPERACVTRPRMCWRAVQSLHSTDTRLGSFREIPLPEPPSKDRESSWSQREQSLQWCIQRKWRCAVVAARTSACADMTELFSWECCFVHAKVWLSRTASLSSSWKLQLPGPDVSPVRADFGHCRSMSVHPTPEKVRSRGLIGLSLVSGLYFWAILPCSSHDFLLGAAAQRSAEIPLAFEGFSVGAVLRHSLFRSRGHLSPGPVSVAIAVTISGIFFCLSSRMGMGMRWQLD